MLHSGNHAPLPTVFICVTGFKFCIKSCIKHVRSCVRVNRRELGRIESSHIKNRTILESSRSTRMEIGFDWWPPARHTGFGTILTSLPEQNRRGKDDGWIEAGWELRVSVLKLDLKHLSALKQRICRLSQSKQQRQFEIISTTRSSPLARTPSFFMTFIFTPVSVSVDTSSSRCVSAPAKTFIKKNSARFTGRSDRSQTRASSARSLERFGFNHTALRPKQLLVLMHSAVWKQNKTAEELQHTESVWWRENTRTRSVCLNRFWNYLSCSFLSMFVHNRSDFRSSDEPECLNLTVATANWVKIFHFRFLLRFTFLKQIQCQTIHQWWRWFPTGKSTVKLLAKSNWKFCKIVIDVDGNDTSRRRIKWMNDVELCSFLRTSAYWTSDRTRSGKASKTSHSFDRTSSSTVLLFRSFTDFLYDS